MKKWKLGLICISMLVIALTIPVQSGLTDDHPCEDMWIFRKNGWEIDCVGQSGPCYCLTLVLEY